MNLFFRRFWLYLTTLFTSKNEPLLHEHSRRFRVWLTDQDMFLHMTNSRYLSFSDLARLNLLMRTGLHKQLHKHGWSLQICAQTRTITRMLKAPQSFSATCEIMGWTDQYLAFRHQFRRGEKIHAEVNTVMRIDGADGGQVAVAALLDAAKRNGPAPELPKMFSNLIQQANAAKALNE